MNEKIQKLAEQANLEIDPAYPDHNQKVLEKFAELIVRECTNMLPADTIRNEDGVHMFYVIREHFGVPTIGR